MKMLFSLALLAASFATANLHAQVYLFGADPAPAPAAHPAPSPQPLPAVVYLAPVIYQAPVVYQGPVIYQAPVFYQAPMVVEAPPSACSPSSATVLYFPGPGGSYQCNPASTVIYFGREEALRRGYQFNHPR